MHFLMVFDFTQFWLDGWPGNEYFWISHKISGLLTPLTPLGVHPQLFKIAVWNRYERFLLLWSIYRVKKLSYQTPSFVNISKTLLFLQTNIFYCVCYDWWWCFTSRRLGHVFQSRILDNNSDTKIMYHKH